MVGDRIDYCNAVLFGTTKSNIQKLQRVQNSLARIVTGSTRSEQIKPVLARLHWLTIAERIEYKVALMKPRCSDGLSSIGMHQAERILSQGQTLSLTVVQYPH